MTLPRIEQANWIPVIATSILAVSGIGVTAVAALPSDSSRRSVTFHNPNYSSGGGIDLLLAQTAAPTFAAPAGGLVLLAGATWLVEGDAAQGAWFVTARSGAAAGLTIMPSMR
jgi:hypothetical protein